MLLSSCSVLAETIPVGNFSSEGMDRWQTHSFRGETNYRTVIRDGIPVVHAESSGAASVLFRELRVDLDKTPYLNWRWQVHNTIPGLDERTRHGDDYPARIYVVTRDGLLPWQTKAINYVWASTLPKETRWNSAFTDSSLMIAVRSGDSEVNTWVDERRNVKADFARFLGKPVHYIDLIALMSDSDNSGIKVSAEYGDIHFSSE